MKSSIVFTLLVALVVSAGCRESVGGRPPSEEGTESAITRPSPTETLSSPPSIPVKTAAGTPTRTAQGNADVIHVRAVKEDGNTWTFHVTVRHPDQGWDD